MVGEKGGKSKGDVPLLRRVPLRRSGALAPLAPDYEGAADPR